MRFWIALAAVDGLSTAALVLRLDHHPACALAAAGAVFCATLFVGALCCTAGLMDPEKRS